MQRLSLVPIACALFLSACVKMPSGPSVMVLPGAGRSFDQFTADDYVCRDWAERRIGITPSQAANDAAASGAAVGTVVGAATGAAIGAAAGSPATGAAVGAGVGLLGGTAVGADRAERSEWALQRRYDMAYMQCMYAMGHQIPVPAGAEPRYGSGWRTEPPPPPRDVPRPPPGPPPPPPPGPVR